MEITAAILTLGVGLVLLLAGYRFGRLAIPLWGFIAGISLGGAIAGDLTDAGFLQTTLGVVAGLTAGVVFALLAYLFYSAAVVILAAGLGYWMGSGFFLLLGFNPGVISVTAGLGLGLLFGLAATLMDAPKLTLIVLTSIAGGVSMTGAILLLFDRIPLESFSYAASLEAVSASLWWSLLALGLAATGMFVQLMTTAEFVHDKWHIGEDDMSGLQTPGRPATHRM